MTGFVNGQTLADATTGTLSFTTTATATSNVGTYAINGSGLTADNGNYVFVQAAGNATALTVNPATLTYHGDRREPDLWRRDANADRHGDRLRQRPDARRCDDRHADLQHDGDAASNVGTYAIDGSGAERG